MAFAEDRSELAEVLSRDIPWETYMTARLITDKDLQLIRRYDKRAEDLQASLIDEVRHARGRSARRCGPGGRPPERRRRDRRRPRDRGRPAATARRARQPISSRAAAAAARSRAPPSWRPSCRCCAA